MTTSAQTTSTTHKPTITSTTAPTTPPLKIHPTSLIHDKATLLGHHPITISANAIIHPFARLDSTHGPISIGEGVVIWEKAVVVAAPISLQQDKGGSEGRGTGVVIEENATVHPHTMIHTPVHIAAHSTIDVGCVIYSNVEIGAFVRISPCCIISEGTVVEDYMSVFMVGEGMVQRVNATVRDREEVRDLVVEGRERERVLGGRLVRRGVKWTG